MYRELSRNDLISLTLSYDEKVKALTEEVCVLQKERCTKQGNRKHPENDSKRFQT